MRELIGFVGNLCPSPKVESIRGNKNLVITMGGGISAELGL